MAGRARAESARGDSTGCKVNMAYVRSKLSFDLVSTCVSPADARLKYLLESSYTPILEIKTCEPAGDTFIAHRHTATSTVDLIRCSKKV